MKPPRLARWGLPCALATVLCLVSAAQPAANSQPDVRFGMGLVKTNGHLAISGVYGQVAYQAGLRPRQFIQQIDGRPTDNMTVEQAVQALKGPLGSRVSLEVLKPGQSAPVRLELTRSVYQPVPSVAEHIVAPRVGLVSVRSLAADSAASVAQVLHRYRAQGLEAVVLDLSDNPGGYSKAAVDIASLFLDKPCVLWITQYKDREEPQSSTPAKVWEGPLVILVNGGTACGAEMLASALQANGRAKILGETTAGRTAIYRLVNPTGTAREQIATVCSAKHEGLHGTGVKPDLVLDLTLPEPELNARVVAAVKAATH